MPEIEKLHLLFRASAAIKALLKEAITLEKPFKELGLSYAVPDLEKGAVIAILASLGLA